MEGQSDYFARAVRDTLDSVVSPAVRESLLSEALTLSGNSELPRDTQGFLNFVTTGLERVLTRALGRELGRSVVAELERLLSPLESQGSLSRARPEAKRGRGVVPRTTERRKLASQEPLASSLPPAPTPPRVARTLPAARDPSDAPGTPRGRRSPSETERVRTASTLPPRMALSHPRPPASADYPSGMASALGMTQSSSPPAGTLAKRARLPIVFVLTRDTELVQRFSTWLDPRAGVVRVERLADLLLNLQGIGDRRSVIVLDAVMPAIRIEAIAALSDELPESLRIVLWGDARELLARLSALFPRVAEWVVCSEHAPLSDVVECCIGIVGS
jgi:hypothetical protein